MDRRNEIYYGRNNFSLKKLGKKIGNIGKDVITLGKAPIALAVSSVTGKKPKLNYKTKVLGAVGKIHDESTKKLTGTVKAVGDTITLGYATKATNLLRKKEDRETAYKYHELEKSNTGMKFVDKASGVVGKVAPVAGALVGGYTLASGLKTAAAKTGLPSSILNQAVQKLKVGANDDADSLRDTSLLEDFKNGNEEVRDDDYGDDGNLLAGFGNVSPIMIGIAILALIFLAMGSSGSSSNGSTKYRRK